MRFTMGKESVEDFRKFVAVDGRIEFDTTSFGEPAHVVLNNAHITIPVDENGEEYVNIEAEATYETM